MSPQPLRRGHRQEPERQRCLMPSRIDARVHLQCGAPALLDASTFRGVACGLLGIEVIEPAGLGFVMAQGNAGRPQYLQTALAQLQRVVDVAIGDRKSGCIEAADRLEAVAAGRQEGAGHRANGAAEMPSASWAGIADRLVTTVMDVCAGPAERDAAMLKAFVGVD